MIRSFADRDTEAIFRGQFVRRLDGRIQQRAREKLKYLDSAADLRDLKIPPSNQLEALHGDRRGQYSIRINQQWRLCFTWRNGDAFDARSPTITEPTPRPRTTPMPPRRLRPVHPGDILKHDFLAPLGLSGYASPRTSVSPCRP